MMESKELSITIPKLSYKRLKQRKKLEYHKNLDINIHDSYINKDDKKIFVQFPVFDDKINLVGIHYHNLNICQILIIHISETNEEEIRLKKMRKFAYLDIFENNLSTINGNFNIDDIDKLHIIIYNVIITLIN